jgi:hypothetical protein
MKRSRTCARHLPRPRPPVHQLRCFAQDAFGGVTSWRGTYGTTDGYQVLHAKPLSAAARNAGSSFSAMPRVRPLT